jgi:hypothetical protein
MPDVFEVLGAAHREMEQMLYLIGGTAEPAAELREGGGALVSAVSRREVIGEQYSWLAVQEGAAGGDPPAAGGAEQETVARKMLTEPDGTAAGDPLFIPLMTRFSRAARAHIACEERQVWPGLRTALPADEARWLGGELAAQQRPCLAGAYQPTRPAAGIPSGAAVGVRRFAWPGTGGRP